TSSPMSRRRLFWRRWTASRPSWIRRWNAGRNWRTWPAEPASGALYRLGRVRSGVLGLVQADRNHVTGGSMENVVGGGSEQQREAMSAVAADHDQIAAEFGGDAVNLLTRVAEGNLHLLFGQSVIPGEQLHALPGLLELLLLKHGQVHGDITAISHGQWFDHMQYGELGAQCPGQLLGMVGHGATLINQIYSYQHM